MSKVNNKTPEHFTVNFEQISHCSAVSIVDFELINPGWVLPSSSHKSLSEKIFIKSFAKNKIRVQIRV